MISPDWRRGFSVFLLYLLLALLITFPAILSPATQFMGGDNSDAYEMARHIWWFKEALQTGQSPFWQSNLGYPDGFSGVSLQADTLQFFPMWLFAFVMPLALAYNVGIWLTMALNGLALYLLAKDRTGSEWGAFLGGVVYMAAPIMQGHLFEGHAGLLVQWPVPLYLLGLFHLVQSEKLSWRWLLWCIVFFQLVPSGHMLQVIYLLLPVTGLFWLARLWQRDWHGAARIVLMGAVSSVLLLLFLLPLIRETLAADNYTDAGGYVRYSADLLAVISPSFMHPLYKALPYTSRVLGVNLGEGALYIGVVAGVLALVGLWRRRAARWWALVGLITWVLALGPLLKIMDTPILLRIGEYSTPFTLPTALIQTLPGFSLARTPGRYGFALSFALAMMAAYGAAALWERWSARTTRALVACGAVGLLIVADYQMFFPVPTRPAAIPQAVYDLRSDDTVRAVYDLPYEHLLGAKDALYLQTAHNKPLIAGQVTRSTPVNPAKLELLQYTLDPSLLKAYGADVIILHKTRAAQIAGFDQVLTLLKTQFPPPFYEDDTLALYRTPDETQPPAFTARLPQDGSFASETHASFYAARPGWSVFTAAFSGESRRVSVFLDQQRLRTLTITGTQTLSLPLPIEDEGFYTVRLVLDPPCPQIDDPSLACRDVSIAGARLTPLTQPFVYSQIQYANVTLHSALISPQDKTLSVYLDWQFDGTVRSENVRFVHILAADGRNVGQTDAPLGDFVAGQQYPELVHLDISALPPGRYSVRAGWYASETVTRFAVQTPGLVGGQDNAPEVGTFTVR